MAIGRVAVGTLAAIVLASTAGCSDGPSASPEPRPTRPEASVASQEHPLPKGCRWESYRDVQVGVPGDWGWGTTGNAICLEDLTDRTVGRPGVGDLLSCEDTNAKNVTFLWFSGATFGNGDPVPLREGGDREVWIIGDVALQLQARKPLQEPILGTVYRIDTDYAGCPETDPISMDPARRPPDPVDVAQLSGVRTVSACQYELAESRRVVEQNEAALVGSVLLTGADAAAAIRRVVAAPVRRGWNRATCFRGLRFEHIRSRTADRQRPGRAPGLHALLLPVRTEWLR
ncbi:MAG: hypothetical protein ACR2JT_01140 [Nocardioidaceae bacterium]